MLAWWLTILRTTFLKTYQYIRYMLRFTGKELVISDNSLEEIHHDHHMTMTAHTTCDQLEKNHHDQLKKYYWYKYHVRNFRKKKTSLLSRSNFFYRSKREVLLCQLVNWAYIVSSLETQFTSQYFSHIHIHVWGISSDCVLEWPSGTTTT